MLWPRTENRPPLEQSRGRDEGRTADGPLEGIHSIIPGNGNAMFRFRAGGGSFRGLHSRLDAAWRLSIAITQERERMSKRSVYGNQRFRGSEMRRWLAQKAAPIVAAGYAWSMLGAPVAMALASRPEPPKGHMRRLSGGEMEHIVGGVVIHALAVGADGGSTYPWEGSVGDLNTGNGNKLTSVPIVGWTARGGLPVAFTLNHSSESLHNDELGQKWTHSYDIYLAPYTDDFGSGLKVHWGNDLSYGFVQNVDGTYSAPTGIHDTLVANGSPVTSYDLTTKNQVKYHFTNPNGTGWYIATISDLNGNTVTVNHNTGNYVTTIVDSTGRTITLTYTGSLITSISDPLSRSWSISYTSGALTKITYPVVSGSTFNEQFGYDANYCITSITDKRGKVSTATYNSDGSLATETDACSNAVTYTYASGQTIITDANSNTVRHNYTSGRLMSVEDQAGVLESYSYDASNNRTGVTDRRGNAWRYSFDSSGNMLTKTDPLTHQWTWTWNSFNEPLTAADPLGSYVANTFDTHGNLTRTDEKNSGGTIQASTTYGYDAGGHGLLVSKTDNNSHTTAYGYGTNGELTSTTTPGTHATSRGVNALGVTTSRTDALSNVTSYTLDNWNRVTLTNYPTGTDPTFTYDANSNLTGWTDGNGTWARTYDNDNRLLTESFGGATQITYAWDAVGKKGLLSTVTDASGRVITDSYNSRNLLSGVTENGATTSYSYDANGNETGVTNPNTTTVTRVFDNANRLTSITNKNSGGTTLSSFSYTYRNDDRSATCTESNGDVLSWSYDAQGHLTGESRTGANAYSQTYVVDGVGNRTSQTIGTKTTSFTYNSDDALTSTASTTGGFVNSYGYNNAGDQTTRTLAGVSNTLAYDYEGQLTSTTQGATVKSFAYDALGRRFSRTAGGVTTRFLYDGSKVLQEKVGATFTSAYAYGNGLIRKDGEYPLFDGLGSERTVTNSSQTVTGTINQDAFGLTVNTTGSSTNPYKFAATSGYRDDGDAGLVHVGARYYDPQVGLFITRDTHLDQKPYLYCEHDPVNAVDPSGHTPALLALIGFSGPAAPYVAAFVVVAVVGIAIYTYANRAGDLPAKGPPNSVGVKDYGGGKGQIRHYGPDGRATVDYDFGHDHGAGDPHAHDWNWDDPSPRGRGRALTELE